GKVVQATTDSIVYSLGEILVEDGTITEKDLEEAVAEQAQMTKPRLLGAILVEKGKVKRDYLLKAIKQQIQNSICELLSWKRGNFEIKLNAIPIGRGIPYIAQDYVYTEGLNIEELLIEATKIIDKSRESQEIALAGSKEKSGDIDSLLGLNEYLEPPQADSEMESITAA